jgi:isoquinoline 1-oxidoreductase subunit beta
MLQHLHYATPNMHLKRTVLGRRDFLRAIGGGSLWIGFCAPLRAAKLSSPAPVEAARGEATVTAWVRIGDDNQVTIIASQAELGQGISTTLPAILADELGADWDAVKIAAAPFAPAYRNPRLNWMFTGNSESAQSFFDLMRKTGAAAREMLTTTAASRWGVSAVECEAKDSAIVHPASGRWLTFGELAADAAKLPVPQNPMLKPREQLKLIGTSLPKVDVPSKVDGSAQFAIDLKLPGMLVAAVRTAPTIGGTLKSFAVTRLKAMPGVRGVVRLQEGVAVVADTYLQARRALAAAPPVFDDGPNARLDSATLMSAYRERLEEGPWATVVNEGDATSALSRSSRTLSLDYENPFAAHATMEPMNCTASVTATRCEIWAPTQGHELAHVALKSVLGLKDEQVVVHCASAIGGGFGRRLIPDFVIQAALVSKEVGRPVKLIWDREEDFLHDFYRPATMVRLTAALQTDGLPSALAARVVSPTILLPVFPPIAKMLKEKGVDPSALEGMMETHYALPNRRVDFHLFNTAVRTSVMRTTGYGPNIFALESFIDELAYAAKVDPYRYRRRLLAGNARALEVLDRAAKLGSWGTPLARGKMAGRGRGIAFAEAFGTLLAQVAEVEVRGDEVKLLRVSSAVDCGDVLDPGIAAAGIEGGIVFGLSYCKNEVTFRNGRPEQTNFNAYELPYLAETPEMHTEFIRSGERLGGIGETSPVTLPPAFANAIFAASGKRLRSMPLSRHGMRLA